MTNKVIYKLKGHEKFPLREGWIICDRNVKTDDSGRSFGTV